MLIKDNLGLTDEGHLVIPRGQKGLPPISINLSAMFKAESRIPEIQRSTMVTLPELITTFLLARSSLANAIATIELEFRAAKRSLKEDQSVALLDKAEDVLKLKNVKSSSDTREAAVILDPDVRNSQQRLDDLTALQTFLTNKNDVMKDAYDGAKKIADMYLKVPYSSTSGESNG